MKKVFRAVATGVGGIVIAKVLKIVSNKALSALKVKLINTNDEKSNEAIAKLLSENELQASVFERVSDSSGIPIYTFDDKLEIEDLKLPKDYVLHKIINASGSEQYAISIDSAIGIYFVAAYFEDRRKWESR